MVTARGEETVDGAEILTRTAAGECAHELFTEPVG